MLLNLQKKSWMDSLKLEQFGGLATENQETMEKMLKLGKAYHKVCFVLIWF